jgi:hypothetical protein
MGAGMQPGVGANTGLSSSGAQTGVGSGIGSAHSIVRRQASFK